MQSTAAHDTLDPSLSGRFTEDSMAAKKYRSLVTGACTPLGSALVEQLSAGAHAVIATDTADALSADDGTTGLASRPVREIANTVAAADPSIPGALDPLLDGIDFVFCANAAPAGAPSWKARYANDVQGTANLIDAVERTAPKLRRLVFLGSAAVHGPVPAGTPALTEDAPTAPLDDVARARHFAEFMVVDRCPRKGIPFTVLRLAHVVGERGAPDLDPLLQWLRLPVVPVPAFLQTRLSLVSVDDVCGAADHVAKYASGKDGIFFVADDTPMTVADVLRTLARGAGRRTIDVPIPGPLAWRKAMDTIAGMDRFLAVRQGRAPLSLVETLAALTHDRTVSNAHLKRDGGYEIQHPDASDGLLALGRALAR
jgi:UDP-glucose 4-epimerase